MTPADEVFLDEFSAKKRILVLNKIDLPRRLLLPTDLHEKPIEICCLTGAGVEPLKDSVKHLAWSGDIRADMLESMINSRHQDALMRAREAIQHALEGLSAARMLELVALDLRIAVNAVGEIVGKTTTEDLLDSIFSQFCIGK
jgi:tRNA modification GTPase